MILSANRAERRHTIAATVLNGYSDIVRTHGGNLERLLASADISPRALDNALAKVRFDRFERLITQTAQVLGCPDFGLKLAQYKQGPEVIPPLDRLIRSSPSLADVFHHCAKRMDLLSTAVRLTAIDHPSHQLQGWRYEFEGENGVISTQIVELFLGMTDLGAVFLTEGRVQAREIWFKHQPHCSTDLYRRYFGANVRFGAVADAIFYQPQDTRIRLSGYSPDTFARELDRVNEASSSDRADTFTRICHAICARFESGSCEREDIALQLGLSIRTLNRRLADRGHSFTSIRDELRRDRATHYLLNTSLRPREVAEKVGLAELATLCRLCQRWFGTTPMRLRKRSGGFMTTASPRLPIPIDRMEVH